MYTASVDLAFKNARAALLPAETKVKTIEEMLLVLLDEDAARAMLIRQRVDIESVRSELRQHIASKVAEVPADGVLVVFDARAVISRAMGRSKSQKRTEVSGTDLLISIVAGGRGFASDLLHAQGLDVAQAEADAAAFGN